MHTIKPLDQEMLKRFSLTVSTIVTLGEHLLAGGLGSTELECLSDDMCSKGANIFRIGIRDQFTKDYGSQDSLMELFGLQPKKIAESIENLYRSI